MAAGSELVGHVRCTPPCIASHTDTNTHTHVHTHIIQTHTCMRMRLGLVSAVARPLASASQPPKPLRKQRSVMASAPMTAPPRSARLLALAHTRCHIASEKKVALFCFPEGGWGRGLRTARAGWFGGARALPVPSQMLASVVLSFVRSFVGAPAHLIMDMVRVKMAMYPTHPRGSGSGRGRGVLGAARAAGGRGAWCVVVGRG